jgi:putative membrane protein
MKQILVSVFALCVMAGCATMTTDDAGMTSGATLASGGARWSDGDIAMFLRTANDGEVQQGQAASRQATREDVRGFANMMVTEHTAANQRAAEVFARAGITPTENESSRLLRENAQTTVRNLATYRGDAFDRRYMQTQVDLHRWLLNTIDTVLLPSARNAELRTLITELRGSVAMHLERAQTLAR